MTVSEQSGWAQAAVALVGAAATIWAVLAALKTSRMGVQTALAIAEREATERLASRQALQQSLAAAFTEELWENEYRARVVSEYASTFPADAPLIDFLRGEMTLLSAPVMEQALTRLDAFDVEDAKLFGRCIARIWQARRSGEALPPIVPNSETWRENIVNSMEKAVEGMPELLNEGLLRAHAIAGLPVSRSAPADMIRDDMTAQSQ